MAIFHGSSMNNEMLHIFIYVIKMLYLSWFNFVNQSKKSVGVSWKILCNIYIVKPMTNSIINIK